MSDMLKLIAILIERNEDEKGEKEEERYKRSSEKGKSIENMPDYANPRFNFPKELINEHIGWNKVVCTLERCLVVEEAPKSTELYAALTYELYMTLTHRMADLRSYELVREESIRDFVNVYIALWKRSSGNNPQKHLCLLPKKDTTLPRYLKAIKSATMTSNDDTPCLSLAKLPRFVPLIEKRTTEETEKTWNSIAENMLKSISTQIYIENTRMLFSGMLELEKNIDPFCFAKEGGNIRF